jgi:hypothetical protein
VSRLVDQSKGAAGVAILEVYWAEEDRMPGVGAGPRDIAAPLMTSVLSKAFPVLWTSAETVPNLVQPTQHSPNVALLTGFEIPADGGTGDGNDPRRPIRAPQFLGNGRLRGSNHCARPCDLVIQSEPFIG